MADRDTTAGLPKIRIAMFALLFFSCFGCQGKFCGHKYQRLGLPVAFEYPSEHTFDFEATELFKEVLKIDKVVSGWQDPGNYSFTISVCRTCNRREIINRVETHVEIYLKNKFCENEDK